MVYNQWEPPARPRVNWGDVKAANGGGAARILDGAIDEEADGGQGRAAGRAQGRAERERAERLRGEAAERLREEDFGDLLSRPFGETVAGVARALGLSPDWLALARDCAGAEAALCAGPRTAGLAAALAGRARASEDYSGPFEVRWLDENDDDEDSG